MPINEKEISDSLQSINELLECKIMEMQQMRTFINEMMTRNTTEIQQIISGLNQLSMEFESSFSEERDVESRAQGIKPTLMIGDDPESRTNQKRLSLGMDGENEDRFCSELDKMNSVLVSADSKFRAEQIEDSMSISPKMKQDILPKEAHRRIIVDPLTTRSISRSLKMMKRKNGKRQRRNRRRVRPSRRQIKWLLEAAARNPLFAQLTKKENKHIISGMHKEEIQRGEFLIREGEINSTFYIVQNGKFTISSDKNELLEIADAHDLLGEEALISREPGKYTVRAMVCAIVWAISASTMRRRIRKLSRKKTRKKPIIRRVLGKISSLKKQRENEEEVELKEDSTVSPNDDSLAAVIPQNMAELEHLGMIGAGGFGVVHLVRDRKTEGLFALKVVRKDLIVVSGLQRQIQLELKTLRRLNNPFVAMLHRTFKDRFSVSFLCDVGIGGDLFHFMRRHSHFARAQIPFYAACSVEALAYLHSLNIVYRDMKPENMVIGADGYLKLTDFGLAKSMDSGDAFTLCGTKEYVAPEVIIGRGHGMAVDWWGLGVFIYEMTACHPPFEGDDIEIIARILGQPITYCGANRRFTDQLQDLINNLCAKEPRDRLGNGPGGAQSVRDHQWFTQMQIDWNALQNRTMRAPYVPLLSHDADRRHFRRRISNPHDSIPAAVDNPVWARDF